MKITKDMLIGDVLDQYPHLAEYFFEIGMHCLGCPHSRGESIEQACEVHGTDADALLAKLNAAIA
ncbi:MAG: DUF1858 domain-containing protein [Clostridia bacterium]|nr:DUF1858 domain-containing protein [Clostridia bacterium]MBR4053938.1 DUF1858 domain-containing protein [Clostridia bacterium]